MALRLLGHIELPENRSKGGFDHADIHPPTDRLYVAHTSNDAVDVIDVPQLRRIAGEQAHVEQIRARGAIGEQVGALGEQAGETMGLRG